MSLIKWLLGMVVDGLMIVHIVVCTVFLVVLIIDVINDVKARRRQNRKE